MDYVVNYKGKTYLGIHKHDKTKRYFGFSEEDNKIILLSKELIDDSRCAKAQNNFQLELAINEVDEYYIPDFKAKISGEYYSIMSANKEDNILYIPTIKKEGDNHPVFSKCAKEPFGYPDEVMVLVNAKYIECLQLEKRHINSKGCYANQETLECDLETLFKIREILYHTFRNVEV